MKKYLTYIILFALSSCTLAPDEWVDFTDYSGLDPKISFIPMGAAVENTITEDVLSECPTPEDGTEESVSRTTSIAGLTLIRKFLSSSLSNSVRCYSGTYWSVDADGNPAKVSGRIILPAKGEISRIVVASHFTIGKKDEAPSITLPMEAVLATHGLAVICPDYIGYGVTPDIIPPYLCKDVTAQNVVDMYFAALPFLKYIDRMPKNDDILIFGYSQGGANTVGVQELFENQYPETKIHYALIGSGPYNIATTYDIYIAKKTTVFPCAAPLIIQGLNEGMHLGLRYADFFQTRVLINFTRMVNSKEYTMGQINDFIGTHDLLQILTPMACDKYQPETARLYRSMQENSVIHGYEPQSPVYFYHSYDDNIVPFENAKEMKKHLESLGVKNITYNFGHYGDHNMGFLYFMDFAVNFLKKEKIIK